MGSLEQRLHCCAPVSSSRVHSCCEINDTPSKATASFLIERLPSFFFQLFFFLFVCLFQQNRQNCLLRPRENIVIITEAFKQEGSARG